VRVPLLVISPWSKGGWVNSQVFDHTSLIRFVEQRFGVMEPNITTWRRTVVGDLTSALNFASPNDAVVSLPSTDSFSPTANGIDITQGPRFADYVPPVPVNQALPQQEPGTRPARALPYELHVNAQVNRSCIELFFQNPGKAGAVFQVRSDDGQTGPWTYTVGAGDETSDNFAATGGSYDLLVYGPNGFLRTFAGSLASDNAVTVKAIYDGNSGGIALAIRNHGAGAERVSIFDAYSGKTHSRVLQPHGSETFVHHLEESFGWYDFTVKVESDDSFVRQLGGHVETGKASVTDPAIAGGVAQAANAG
jgi:phospholipase C